MTFKDVKAELQGHLMTITRTTYDESAALQYAVTDYDEYRVNYQGGSEPTAYYTDDLEDARKTGIDMSLIRKEKRK